MKLNDECRLCLSENELVWVFDSNLECKENIKEVILLTSGVQMSEDDVVSQKVCNHCFKVVFKMYEYRQRAIKADLLLKAQYKKIIENTTLVDKLQKNILCNNTESLIKPKTPSKELVSSNCKKDYDKENLHIETPPEAKKPRKQVHRSVIKVLSPYPNLKVPTSCLTLNIDPIVYLEIDDNINQLLQEEKNFSCNKIPDSPKENVKIQVTSVIIDRSNVNKKLNEGNRNVVPVENTEVKSVAKDDGSNILTQTVTNPEKVLETNISKTITNSDSSPKKTLFSIGTSQITYPISPSFLERLGLVPSKIPIEYKCRTCSSVFKTKNALKTHRQIHLTCKFCFEKFRGPNQKEKHEKCCKIMIMNNKPYVLVERLQNIDEYIQKCNIDKATKDIDKSTKDIDKSTGNINTSTSDINQTDDVIIILDDEDSNTVSPTKDFPVSTSTKENLLADNCSSKIISVAAELDKENSHINSKLDISEKPEIIRESFKRKSGIPIAKGEEKLVKISTNTNGAVKQSRKSSFFKKEKRKFDTLVSNKVDLVNDNTESGLQSTTSLIKPDVRIANNTLLDDVDVSVNSNNILKTMVWLTKAKKTDNNESQTNRFTDNLIINNHTTYTATLKNCFSQLSSHKIPVLLKNGNFNVKYIEQQKQSPKKKQKWPNASDRVSIGRNFHSNNFLKLYSQKKRLLRISPPKKSNLIRILPNTSIDKGNQNNSTTNKHIPSTFTKLVPNNTFQTPNTLSILTHDPKGNQNTQNSSITNKNTPSTFTNLVPNNTLSMMSQDPNLTTDSTLKTLLTTNLGYKPPSKTSFDSPQIPTNRVPSGGASFDSPQIPSVVTSFESPQIPTNPVPSVGTSFVSPQIPTKSVPSVGTSFDSPQIPSVVTSFGSQQIPTNPVPSVGTSFDSQQIRTNPVPSFDSPQISSVGTYIPFPNNIQGYFNSDPVYLNSIYQNFNLFSYENQGLVPVVNNIMTTSPVVNNSVVSVAPDVVFLSDNINTSTSLGGNATYVMTETVDPRNSMIRVKNLCDLR